ncbi:hypothetical protein KKF84_19230 [Myxococcota bacterium]|nr:hypothetical protein [Myxococcota bacterium]MBU1537456.1 hypothetical protein [Myxococcota bacterium]
MNASQEMITWRAILQKALKLPSVRVSKHEWFNKVLSPFTSDESVNAAIESSPLVSGLEPRTLKRIAERTVRAHRRGVTALSLVTGLPGGIAIVGAVPADLAQFFWHLLKVSQKLTLLYGWPPLLGTDGSSEEADEQTRLLITVFMASMFGSDRADDLLVELHKTLVSQKGLGAAELLEAAGLAENARDLEQWMGHTVARDSLTKALARVVPVIGGIFSGTLTYIAFSRMGKHLDDLLFRLTTQTP